MLLAKVAEAIGASISIPASCPGNASDALVVERLSPPDTAKSDALCFVQPSYRGSLSEQAGAVVVARVLDDHPGVQLVVAAVAPILPSLLALFKPVLPPWGAPRIVAEHPSVWISESASVAAGVVFAPGVIVGPGATVGHGSVLGAGVVVEPLAQIGEGCHLEARAVVGWGSVVGSHVRLGRGVVVGSEGFGYQPGEGGVVRLPHVGRVVLEDGVEIGAGSTIDRAMVGETRIGAGTKLDNQVHIAHSVCVGRSCLIAAQAGIAGSARIGDGVQIGGQAGVAGHLHVGDGVRIAGKAGVTKRLPAGGTVAGMPAVDIRLWRRMVVAWERLPEALRRLREEP